MGSVGITLKAFSSPRPEFQTNLVQKPELAARLVDRIGTDFGAVAVNRIEVSLLTIERDELRVGHGLERLQQRPSAAPIDPVHADAFSFGIASRAGKTPDIGKQRKGGSGRFRGSSILHRNQT